MAFIPTVNAAVAVLKYAVAGRIVTSTVSWLGSVPFDTTRLADLASNMRDAWSELLIGAFTPAYTLTEISITAQDSETAPFFDLVVSADNVGTAVGTPQGANVCVNVGLKTGSRGRSYRGVIKHPSTITEHLATKTRWDSTYLGFMQSSYSDYISAVRSAVMGAPNHVVISRETDGAPRVAGVATPVTFYNAYPRVGSLPRRTR
jgi:hypothetical protein